MVMIIILYWLALRRIPENIPKARIILHKSVGQVQIYSNFVRINILGDLGLQKWVKTDDFGKNFIRRTK